MCSLRHLHHDAGEGEKSFVQRLIETFGKVVIRFHFQADDRAIPQ